MTTYVNSGNFQDIAISEIDGPKITSITVTDSSYVPTGGSTISTSGGYVQIVGKSFSNPMQVFIDQSTPATSVSYVNTTTINVQLPTKTAGNYTCFVVRTNDGQFASKINGLTYA